MYWLWQFAGWGGLFVVTMLPAPFRNEPIGYRVFVSLSVSIVGLLLTHLLRIAFLFHLQRQSSWPALMLRLTPWVVVAAVAHVNLVVWLASHRLPDGDPALMHRLANQRMLVFLENFTLCGPLMTIWAGFYLGLRYYRQYQVAEVERFKLAAAVRDAELRALKAQINPHFLFNCLNSLRALIPRELAAPRDALTLLADLLRASLILDHDETVPLARELETVDNYLALEHLRFERRLKVRRTIAPDALALLIPPFALQTLVENAVKYGLGPREEGAEIVLDARVSAGTLRLSVINPGTLATASASTGLGLTNTRARLRLLFGPASSLVLRQAADGVVEAVMLIPARTAATTP